MCLSHPSTYGPVSSDMPFTVRAYCGLWHLIVPSSKDAGNRGGSLPHGWLTLLVFRPLLANSIGVQDSWS